MHRLSCKFKNLHMLTFHMCQAFKDNKQPTQTPESYLTPAGSFL